MYQAERKIIFFQDVVRNKVSKGLVIGVPEKFNVDTEQILKDAYKLMQYDINHALFGHGEPILILITKSSKNATRICNAEKELMVKIKKNKANSNKSMENQMSYFRFEILIILDWEVKYKSIGRLYM